MDRDLCYELNKEIEFFAQEFAKKYFCDEDGLFTGEIHFVEDSFSDELNYNLYVNDCYFSLQDMFYALRYDIPKEVLFEWYDHQIDAGMKGEKTANLKNYFLAVRVENVQQ